VFNLVAAIGNKKPHIALDIYNNMLFMKVSPLAVLKMVARQFRLILQCKYLAKKGMQPKLIAEEIGSRDFIVQNCLQQSRNFTIGGLMRAIQDCADCDVNFKRGDEMGVETLILKYSR
jgi:DNA polymerase-3 subunit delta